MKMRTMILVTVLALSGIAAQTVQAGGSPGNHRLRKLGRGLSNIATGVLEIPRNVRAVQVEQGDMAAVTYGTARGLWRTGVRSVVGVVEVITFPVPTTPIVEPEFLANDGLVDAVFRPGRHTHHTMTRDWQVKQPEKLD